MPPKHLQSSITLPRNFTFHYTDAQPPRTPEPLETRELGPPLSPRPDRIHPGQQPTNFGPHRQRPSCATSASHDLPLPSIEGLNRAPSARLGQIEGQIAPAAALRVPPRTQLRFATPTRTPDLAPAPPVHEHMACRRRRRRRRTRADEGESDASASRPPSACSIFSDSSVSSSGTSASGPSFTSENVRSPDLDVSNQIELAAAATTGKPAMVSSSMDRRISGRTSKQPKWTDEMDRHLWATYLRYLQDPTMTPFRYDPGRPPPLGVCHRVAREARKTWKGSGPRNAQSRRGGEHRSVHDQAHALPSIMETASSAAPLYDSWSGGPPEAPKPIVAWPRSESATRRRLRELCQQRTGHTSHAQKQLKSRNPPPVRDVRPRLASPFGGFVAPASFSTRDMSLSLAISSSVSMRPDGPLARMTRGELDAIPSDEGWFGRPPNASSSAALLPEPSGSILEPSGLGAGQNLTRLRSPFTAGQPAASGPSSHQQQRQYYQNPHQRPATFSSRPHSNNLGGQRSTLRSPVRLTSTTLPLPGVTKHRAQRQFEDDDNVSSNRSPDTRRNILEELIGSPVFQGGGGGRQRAIRNRGFSLGDTSAAERLANLFQPPDDDGGTPQPRHGQSPYYHQSSHNAGLHGSSSPFGGSNSLTPTGPSQRQVPERLGSPFRSVTPRPAMDGIISGHQRTESVPEMFYGFVDEPFHLEGRSTHWNNGRM